MRRLIKTNMNENSLYYDLGVLAKSLDDLAFEADKKKATEFNHSYWFGRSMAFAQAVQMLEEVIQKYLD